MALLTEWQLADSSLVTQNAARKPQRSDVQSNVLCALFVLQRASLLPVSLRPVGQLNLL